MNEFLLLSNLKLKTKNSSLAKNNSILKKISNFNDSLKKLKIFQKWKMAELKNFHSKRIFFFEEFLNLYHRMTTTPPEESLLKFVDLFEIQSYEIHDFIYEEEINKILKKAEIPQKIDFTKLNNDESYFLMENSKIFNGNNDFDLKKFFILSKKYQYLVILVLEKNDKKEKFVNSWKNEIFAFFVGLMQEIRKNYFLENKTIFLKEILKPNELSKIINLLIGFFESTFKENFSIRIKVTNQKKKLFDEKIDKQRNTAEFLNEGKQIFFFFSKKLIF